MTPAKMPFVFRNGKVATNRIFVPAMASKTADETGSATEVTVAHYDRLARSGAGIVFVEYSFVHQSGKAEPRQLGMANEDHQRAAVPIAQTIHKQGSLAGLQIAHAGGKTTTAITGMPLQSPSGVVVPARGRDLEIPVALSEAQIQDWKKWFVDAALRVAGAGFDMVELHGAHGYGLNQWMSPLTNTRSGAYGRHERSRLVCEIVSAIRASVPQLLVSVRLAGRDFLEGGLEESDMVIMAQQFVEAGVDVLNVSSGLGGWNTPEAAIEEGFLVPQAAVIQQAVSVPVVGVGGIKTLEFVNQGIKRRSFEFAAVGRAILHGQWRWD
jgi:NADPH2 dehydrogenase